MNGLPDSVPPSATEQPNDVTVVEPTPVEDLAKRLQMLREHRVRAYKDGSLEIVFAADVVRPRETMEEKAFRQIAEMDAASRGGE
jgi:hypothetical protein